MSSRGLADVDGTPSDSEVQPEPVRIRNLDTGEYITLDELGQSEPSDPMHASTSQDEASKAEKTSWLKGKGKLSKWAKSTLSKTKTTLNAIQERVAEQVEQFQEKQLQRASEQLERPRASKLSMGSASSEADTASILDLEAAQADDRSVAPSHLSMTSDAFNTQTEPSMSGRLLDDDMQSMYSNITATSKALPPVPKRHALAINQTVKVHINKGPPRHLHQVRLVQQLQGHEGVIWAMKLNRDSTLLATAGQDGVVRVWNVFHYNKMGTLISASGSDAEALPETSSNANRPVFRDLPAKVFLGHTEDVLDLSWSQGSFLLSASVDKTVRLWHIADHECLREYSHPDFVTSVQFHPSNSKRFVTGCCDGVIRVWSVLDGQQLASATVHQDMITAVTYSGDGQQIVAGTMHGKCRFYKAATGMLDYIAQVDVKDHAAGHGHKVTGMVRLPGTTDDYVITSNDSRIRRYIGLTQTCKYKGLKNRSCQIRAALSPTGHHVVCGSEDGRAYVWDTFSRSEKAPQAPEELLNPRRSNSRSITDDGTPTEGKAKNARFESFQTDEDTTTVVLVAPHTVRRVTQAELAVVQHRLQYQHVQMQQQQGLAVLVPFVPSPLLGCIFFVAGFSGRISVFENL